MLLKHTAIKEFYNTNTYQMCNFYLQYIPLTLIWMYLDVCCLTVRILLEQITAIILKHFYLIFFYQCIILAC